MTVGYTPKISDLYTWHQTPDGRWWPPGWGPNGKIHLGQVPPLAPVPTVGKVIR